MNALSPIEAAAQGLPSTRSGVTVNDYYIKKRSREPASILIALNASERKNVGVNTIEIVNPPALIEVGQKLEIIPGPTKTRTWRGREFITMTASAVKIVPYEGRTSPKIDYLDSATCKALAKRFGADYAKAITDNPALLEQTRFSAEKRATIVNACSYETLAALRVKHSQKRVLEALLWAGVTNKTEARAYAKKFEIKKGKRGGDSPYRLLFEGDLSFKTADRFALKFDPETALQVRPQAIVIAALRTLADGFSVAKGSGHTLATADEIEQQAWCDFGLAPNVTRAAIETLKATGAITMIDRPKKATDGASRQLFGVAPQPFVGLSTLILAEQRIQSFTARTHNRDDDATEVLEDKATYVETAIADAGELLDRPGFVLDDQQALAVRRMFATRLSIITGPPGSGKTTIAAMAMLVGKKIYADFEKPIYGVALAGRAASMLQDNASIADQIFPASTIHRALGIGPAADGLDSVETERNIQAPVLVIDESSMIDVTLLAAVLGRTSAGHVVMLGDIDQLPPIGAGSPFADLIGSGIVPVTHLEQNHRTELAGIRALTQAINESEVAELAVYVEMGGVAYRKTAFRERGNVAGVIWRKLVKDGVDPHEIAVITPKNIGDEGTRFINRDIREKLGFRAPLQKGEIILVTENNYRAPSGKGDETVAIYNGERCKLIEVGTDVCAGVFPAGRGRPERVVRFLHNGYGPPEGTDYGYAMTVHRAQGSQFEHVLLVTTLPDGFVKRSSIYTAASRARKLLTIIGDETELAACAENEETPRRTYLSLKANGNG